MIMSLVTRVLIILTVLACASCTVNAGGLRNGAVRDVNFAVFTLTGLLLPNLPMLSSPLPLTIFFLLFRI